MKAELFKKQSGELLEGPIWSQDKTELVFVDILQNQLMFLNVKSKDLETFDFSHQITSVGNLSPTNWLISTRDSLITFNRETQSSSVLAELPLKNTIRFNDGKFDPFGRYWIGTMSEAEETGAGSLYYLDDNNNLQQAKQNLTISNGIAWDLSNEKMYHIDTPSRKIAIHSFDQKTTLLEDTTEYIDLSMEKGSPDGMTIDQKGHLWVAMWGGYAVLQIDPIQKRVVHKVEVDAPLVTSCTFGGVNNDTLFITTARYSLADEELLEYPDSGSVFAVTIR